MYWNCCTSSIFYFVTKQSSILPIMQLPKPLNTSFSVNSLPASKTDQCLCVWLVCAARGICGGCSCDWSNEFSLKFKRTYWHNSKPELHLESQTGNTKLDILQQGFKCNSFAQTPTKYTAIWGGVHTRGSCMWLSMSYLEEHIQIFL